LDEVRELKSLRTEIPSLLEQPREIITPGILINFSAINIFLLVVLIVLVIFVPQNPKTPQI
jgi:hypothetical protein